MCVGNGKSKSGMQMPGSIAAANLPCDDRPSDAAFGHVVFGRNATILRPLNLKSAVQRRKHLAEARGVRVTATAFSRINGGDREKLIPANNLVSNCDIHHSAKFHRTYAPAIGIGGCGQRVVGCRLPRTP